MIGTVFRSEELPPEVRFDQWRELVGLTRSPSAVDSEFAGEFWARFRVMELGAVTVWPTSFLPARFHRSQKLVRRSDPEAYHLSLLLDGGLALDHMDRSGTFGPRDLHVVDSSRPYDLRPYDGPGGVAVTGIGVDFPKALLPVPAGRVRELLGRRLPGESGMGALLAEFLMGLERQAEVLEPADAPRLGAVVLDLVSAWFAQVLEAEAALSPETRQRALVERIKGFIRQNLHDPELTPPVVAAAHYISLSYLHRVFAEQAEGETVAAWIRGQRLEGARRELGRVGAAGAGAAGVDGVPIHVVAARWGIPRASDFSRAFRGAYGVSPREYRARAGRGGAGDGEGVPGAGSGGRGDGEGVPGGERRVR